jgi:hypothetical protein
MAEEISVEVPVADAPVTTEGVFKSASVQDVIKRISADNDPAPIEDEQVDDTHVDEVDDSEEATGDPGAPADEPTTWITDHARQVARSHGMTDDDLAVFESQDEFAKTVRFLNRQAAQARPEATPAVAPKAEAEAVVDADQKTIDGKINPEYFKKRTDLYDEDYILAMETLRAQQDAVESLKKNNEATQQQAEVAAQSQYENALHDILDERQEGFYGKSVDKYGQAVSVGAAEGLRRGRIKSQVEALAQSYHLQGQQVPALEALIDMAETVVFRKELAEREVADKGSVRQGKLERIAAQSRTRRPVASAVGAKRAYVNAPPAEPGTTKAIYQSPEVQSVLRSISESNGY